MRPARTIAAVIAGYTLRVAAARGVDPAPLAARMRLAEAGDDPLHPIDLDAYLAVYGDIVRALDDPGWPIHLATRLRPEDYSVVGFALLTAPSGRAALDRAVRYQQLHCPASRWQVDIEAGEVRLTWSRPGPPGLGQRAANEGVLAEFVHTARALLGPLPLIEVSFAHAAPRDVSAHAAFFGCSLRWNAAVDALRWSAAGLDAVPRQANPAMAAYFEQQLDARLAALEPGLVVQVERHILHRLPSGTPSLVEVARDLGQSPRTLRRRLAEAGTGFSEVLDRVRQREADHLLRAGRSTVAEVAWLLGFSDASAFTRAFRRWFGTAPGAHA
ncbi:MAG: AraC family transcriptional regulator [Myxococcales bacterium]|nr:AraC family transcriptional regulator [Myxococcales bacterium]